MQSVPLRTGILGSQPVPAAFSGAPAGAPHPHGAALGAPAMSAPGMAPPAMSDPWKQVSTPDGKPYWHNVVTNETAWTRPAAPAPVAHVMPAAAPAAVPIPAAQVWTEYTHTDGRKYYYNQATKQTTWTRPREMDAQPGAAIPTVAAAAHPVAVSTHAVAAAAPVTSFPSAMSTMAAPAAAPVAMATATPMVTTAVLNAAQAPTGAAAKAEENTETIEASKPVHPKLVTEKPNYKTSSEAKEGFREMLYDLDVMSNWPWDKIVRACSKDARFDCLRKGEKKQVWNQWKGRKSREEKEERRVKLKKARDELFDFFVSQDCICPELPWSEAFQVFQAYPELNRTLFPQERDLRSIYVDAIHERERAIKAQVRDVYRKRQEAFQVIFDDLPESVNKRSWDDIVDALKEVPEYCDDPQFEEDGILDVLTVYESHLADLDQRAERQRARTAQLSRRKYRKTREAFLGMMQELEQQGRIHADSLWRSVYPDIAERKEYIDMLGQPGLTPLDLFKLRVEELYEELRTSRYAVRDYYEDNHLEFKLDTTQEEFEKVLSEADKLKDVPESHRAAVFKYMTERAQRHHREAQKKALKKDNSKVYNFRKLMRRNLKTFKADTKWADISNLFKDEAAVKAFETEEELSAAFEEYTATDPWSNDLESSDSEDDRDRSQSRHRSHGHSGDEGEHHRRDPKRRKKDKRKSSKRAKREDRSDVASGEESS